MVCIKDSRMFFPAEIDHILCALAFAVPYHVHELTLVRMEVFCVCVCMRVEVPHCSA